MRRVLTPVLLIGILALLLWGNARPHQRAPAVIAAPNVFTGPVNGGCYAQTPSQCRIHVDNWQPIPVSPGQKLLGFQLRANGQPLYNFRTDVSNPPASNYQTSLVAQDYAIQCGSTYSLTLLVEDTGSGGLQLVGNTNDFTCPLLETPTTTPTPTNTPTATPTPTNTPTATPTPTNTPTATPTSSSMPNVTSTPTNTPTPTRTPATVLLPNVTR